jgi:hypothetical protein
MGDATPEPPVMFLLSQYKAERRPNGRLMLRAASPLAPILGCAVPAVVAGILSLLIGAAGVTVLVLLFAAVVVLILLYNGARAWECWTESIQPGIAIGSAGWYPREQQTARSVVLKREVWGSNRGSTDIVLVELATDRRMKILSVHNWAGHESRLASGGRGSLSRSGPVLPTAPEPLRKAQDTSLLWLASEAVRELVDVLHRELGTTLKFECEEIPFRPRGR